MPKNATPRSRTILAPLFGLALLVTACAGDDGGAETAGVASVTDVDQSAVEAAAVVADGDDTDAVDASVEEAGLLLSACMRDSGYPDFPDPTLDAQGNLDLRDAITNSGINFRDETVRAQLDECRDEAGADNFGAGGGGGDREAIQEQLLAYTDCLRTEGLDVGDLDFAGGQGQAQDGDAGAGRGQAQGNGGAGGGRGDRIAGQLGLDAEDPATAAAMDACQPTLDQALAGIGAPGGAAPSNSDS